MAILVVGNLYIKCKLSAIFGYRVTGGTGKTDRQTTGSNANASYEWRGQNGQN